VVTLKARILETRGFLKLRAHSIIANSDASRPGIPI